MSQRNPMNERYTSEERTGTTRKSAASAKPKAKAAASVTVKSAKKTPEQRKAEEKAARKAAAAKQREVERKYYKPDTPRYKRLRLIWWILLIAAIGCTTLSFVGQQSLPPQVAVVTLILAYVFIIAAFVLDFWKIKKERVAYQERMLALEEKNAKAEKQARRVQQAKQVKVGDTAEVSNYYWGGDVQAVLEAITSDPDKPGQGKLLVFRVTGEIEAGTTISLSIGQRSANYDSIIPKSALREDTNGQFVLVVTAKNSPLGNRYVATRADVQVLAEDDTSAAVTGLVQGDYVITTSSKPLEAGTQVRLVENQ